MDQPLAISLEATLDSSGSKIGRMDDLDAIFDQEDDAQPLPLFSRHAGISETPSDSELGTLLSPGPQSSWNIDSDGELSWIHDVHQNTTTRSKHITDWSFL